MQKHRSARPESQAFQYQDPGCDTWVTSTAIRCTACRGMIFLQSRQAHSGAGVQLAVCVACIRNGWLLDPQYAADHPEVAQLFHDFRAKVHGDEGQLKTPRGNTRPARAAFHEHPRIDEELVRKLARPVDELGMSVRLAKCLAGQYKLPRKAPQTPIVYVVELVCQTPGELSKRNMLGPKTLLEAKGLLELLGLQLAMRLTDATIKATRALIEQQRGPR